MPSTLPRSSRSAAEAAIFCRQWVRASALSVGFLAAPTLAGAADITVLSPSLYNSDTPAMDGVLGITGYAIEDFEDIALINGLSIETTNPDSAPKTELDQIYVDGSGSFFNNSWDGSGAAINQPNNDVWYGGPSGNIIPTLTESITFHIADCARSFGIGLGNFQADRADHAVYVNDVLQVAVLGDEPNFVTGVQVRNGYLIIDAAPDDPICSVRFENHTVGTLIPVSGLDGLLFDHLAFVAADTVGAEFTDWQSADPNANTASGDLCGAEVELTTDRVGQQTFPQSGVMGATVDESDTFFSNSSWFTPSSRATDLAILGATSDFTIAFTPPVVSPTLHIFELNSNQLTFDTPFSLVSSDGTFEQVTPTEIRGESESGQDSSGSLLFEGLISEIRWTSDGGNPADGIRIQVSAPATCDIDTDGDGLPDSDDVCPTEDSRVCDVNGDGCIDQSDDDGVNDCEDACPEDGSGSVLSVWYEDLDGDDFGNGEVASSTCSQPEGFVANDDDCNDEVFEVNPNAEEICGTDDVDENCDGFMDTDADADGLCESVDDCPNDAHNDADNDGICGDVDDCPNDPDNDADADDVCGDIDVCADFDDAIDSDNDDLPDACDDCPNDADNDIDNDGICGDFDECDGADSSGDSDGDGVCDDIDLCIGNDASTDSDDDGQCDDLDCNDDDNTIFPGAVEACNGVDDDCDDVIPLDESDADGDTYRSCDGDCDDDASTIYSGAPELCDTLDNNCDGTADEGFVDDNADDVLDCLETDSDGDGQFPFEGDCNDDDATVYEGAPELCDGIDNGCTGTVPLGERDADGDDLYECEGDCDDAVATVYDGAPELCDGIDNNCDGALPDDEQDFDADGVMACEGDCADDNADVYPGNTEVNDGIDNNCDDQLLTDELHVAGGCNCTTVGSSAPLWPLLPLFVTGMLARRRLRHGV
jgi:hypothetical protein